MAAEVLLGGGQGSSAGFSSLEAPVVRLHEGGGGLIAHLPEAEEAGAGTGHGDGAPEAVDAFSSSGFPGAGLAGGDHNQLGALPVELARLGGEVPVFTTPSDAGCWAGSVVWTALICRCGGLVENHRRQEMMRLGFLRLYRSS